jgi:hypothetical protein
MDPNAQLADLSRTIELAIAPVFVLTALGTMLSVLSSRLGRIVDRSRVLVERLPGRESTPPQTSETAQYLDRSELDDLRERRHLINRAITAATLAMLLVSLLIAVAFVGFIFNLKFANTLAGLFIAAMVALIVSLLLFLREVLVAVRSAPWNGEGSPPPSLRP